MTANPSHEDAPTPSPLLSVIVPVYDVQDYLSDCLDSLLEDPGVDVEVIAVDDCSTDSSRSILDRHAARDRRLKVIGMDRNRGLGNARNAGLDVATGAFIWFVDSDDWVTAGALRRVERSLRERDPDVLLVGHARVTGADVERPASERHLASFPPVFTAEGAPQVFELSSSACVKVVRRDLLEEHDLRFPSGAYEDKPVAIPLLVAATRISALPDVCYYYRQRVGSIVQASGRHHIDLIRQLELVRERVEQVGPSSSEVHDSIFAESIRYLFHLLGTERIAAADRPVFLRSAAEFAKNHRPPRYRAPSRTDALRLRLLAIRSLRLVDVLAVTSRRYREGRRMFSGLLAAARLRMSGGAVHLLRRSALKLYYRWHQTRPVDPTLALYIAYWGREVLACNPGAIFEKAKEIAPSSRGVWAVSTKVDDRNACEVPIVTIGSAAYYKTLARARFIISNTNLTDQLQLRTGTTFLHTHHGTPLKAMGLDLPGQSPTEATQLLHRCSSWNVSLSSNPHSSSVWRRAYPVRAAILETGYPRNDRLATATTPDLARVRESLKIPRDAKAILYAPTFRDDEDEYQSKLDAGRLAKALGPEYFVLLRAHYFYDGVGGRAVSDHGRVMDVSSQSIVDMCLAADVLITDYSSVMFDYAVLDRPIVLFAPDWDHYFQVRGTYFDLEEVRPGVLVRTFDELVTAFRAGRVDDADARLHLANFRRKFCPWDDGRASERVVNAVMLDDRTTRTS